MNAGLLNRLLPQLHETLPLDAIKADRNLVGLSKTEINEETMQCVREWLTLLSKVDAKKINLFSN
jgi:hypothetical protein